MSASAVLRRALSNDRRVRRRGHVPAALLVTATAAATMVGTSTSAGASAAPVKGSISSAWQDTVTHQVHVHGWAMDPAAPHRSVEVGVYVDGTWRKTIAAHLPTRTGKKGGLHGHHTFDTTVRGPKTARRVSLLVHRSANLGSHRTTDAHGVKQVTPQGERIVSVARRYVGSRYVYGASGPHAFDCSGYAMFVYRKADVASLPHNSEAQRHARHMHRIGRSDAKPGDLVFYLSGGSAYHVSIYAGHGDQYSATDPSQGVRHQKIWASNVEFASDWH